MVVASARRTLRLVGPKKFFKGDKPTDPVSKKYVNSVELQFNPVKQVKVFIKVKEHASGLSSEKHYRTRHVVDEDSATTSNRI